MLALQRLLLGSIRNRIMSATTLLVVMIVGSAVWLMVRNESNFYRKQKIQQARALATVISQSLMIELAEANWGNMRIRMELLMQSNPDLVYAIASDAKLKHQVVASSPTRFEGQYVPDIVPLNVTQSAIATNHLPRIRETYALTDIEYPKGRYRARQGDRLIEVAINIPKSSDRSVMAGTFRVGINLRQLEQEIAIAVLRILIVGFVGLGIGLTGAYILSRRISDPILKLRTSAALIAAGNLKHRAEIKRTDEIGALAQSFNEMSASLQTSFGRLQKTLESFERFVPDKFLKTIAPRGIENIQVGECSTHHMTILFCDMRGYTTLSEMLTPQETFTLLNDYLHYMGHAIGHCGGFIDKFIGDAIMALFDDESTDGALKAAIAMQEALKEFNANRFKHGLPTVEIGIGIHRGEVVMGTIGFTSRIESTVIGDAVNVASRVEGLTKEYSCQVLVTDSVVKALRQREWFDLELVNDSVKVKGKETAIALYKLLSPFS